MSLPISSTVLTPNTIKSNTSTFCLFAANSTEIAMYGQKLVKVELNVRCSFKWEFTLADVKCPLLRFLTHFGLLIYLKNHCFIDALTEFTSKSQFIKVIKR